jgi:hypothetical protein
MPLLSKSIICPNQRARKHHRHTTMKGSTSATLLFTLQLLLLLLCLSPTAQASLWWSSSSSSSSKQNHAAGAAARASISNNGRGGRRRNGSGLSPPPDSDDGRSFTSTSSGDDAAAAAPVVGGGSLAGGGRTTSSRSSNTNSNDNTSAEEEAISSPTGGGRRFDRVTTTPKPSARYGNSSNPLALFARGAFDSLPRLRLHVEPTTTLKLKKRFQWKEYKFWVAADYHLQDNRWRFQTSCDDIIIPRWFGGGGGVGSVILTGRELQYLFAFENSRRHTDWSDFILSRFWFGTGRQFENGYYRPTSIPPRPKTNHKYDNNNHHKSNNNNHKSNNHQTK